MKQLIILLIFTFFISTSYNQVLEQDSLALVDFYNETNGPDWHYSSNWLTGPVCDWFGIVVSENRVKEVVLTYNNIDGEIPPSIGNLTELEKLIINDNQLFGTIPIEITNLVRLKRLSIGDNLYSGEFPAILGSLDSLKILSAQQNNYTGQIPPEIFNMPNLEYLQLYWNQFSGELPQVVNLNSLQTIDLWYNSLSGEIPVSLCNCPNLESLNLGENNLTGEIPSEINNLTELCYLKLSSNNFTGALPPIPNLYRLKRVRLSWNQFDGMPDFTINDSLQTVRIQGNKLTFEDIEPYVNNNYNFFEYIPQDSVGEEQVVLFETGVPVSISIEVGGSGNLYQWFKFGDSIPDANDSVYTILSPNPWDAGNYSCNITSTIVPQLTLYSRPFILISDDIERNALTALYVSTNGDEWDTATNWLSSAPLCDWYGIDTTNGYVTGIRLTRNHLVGELPEEICDLDSLQILDFYVNQINGAVPDSIINLVHLTHLKFTYNNLEENPLPILIQMPWLQVLDLKSNHFGGTIPSEISNLINLKELDISSCGLENPIPISLFDLSGLESLKLDYNEFTGNFPNEIVNLTSLKCFCIRNWNSGQFLGEILPLIVQLPALEYVVLSGNNFTGQIPSQINNLTNLETIYLSSNNFTGSIPNELGNLSNLKDIGLGNNEFVGTIPNSFQNLQNLFRLSASENQLSGPFPTVLCNLPELQYLYLYQNEFSGPLPPELGNLINLRWLYISNNNFTEIPSEIGNLDSLGLLYISNNEISSLPSEMGNMSNIGRLRLSGNNLDSVPFTFSNLHSLRELTLSYNGLTSCIFNIDSLTELEKLHLSHNYLTFESIEPYVDIEEFYYTNQELIGEDTYIDVQIGDPLDISVDIGGDYNLYQWYRYDIPIPGANNDHYTIDSVTFDDFGIYYCIIANSLATELILVSYNFYVGEIYGLEDQIEQKYVSVFPNPAEELLYFKLAIQNTIRFFNIELRNLKGQLVKEVKNIQSPHYAMNVGDLKAGVYFYVIKENGEVVQQGKLIKK